MDDPRRAILPEEPADQRAIADVAVDEHMRGIVGDGFQRVEISGVSQLVEVDDADPFFGQDLPDKAPTDKTRAAGDEDGFHLRLLSACAYVGGVKC